MSAQASEQEAPYGPPVPALPAVPVPAPVTRSQPRARDTVATASWAVAKRTLDMLAALVGLLALLPLLLLVALLVKLDSPGPVLFRQRRFGLHRRTFTVLKFRTMTHQAPSDAHREFIAALARGEAGDGELKKLTADSRVTRIGAFLRRTSLDELPQLLNVLAGQMSLVGPRPAIEYELEHYAEKHFSRFEVKPGLTGLWQVSGRSRLGFTEMLELDAQYASSSGPLTDAKILLRTPLEIFRGRCA